MTGVLSPYDWMLLLVEGILGSVLVLIFMQSIPLLSPGRYKPALKNEEIVCIIILIASILTGTIGWEFYNIGVEQVFSRYFVLLLRSEEHTSEFQSRGHLVCRLLLEKKIK